MSDAPHSNGTPPDRTPPGIAMLEEVSGIVHANASMAALLGVEAAALHGRRLGEFIVHEDRGAAMALVRSVRSGKSESETADIRFQRSDGIVRWGALSIATSGPGVTNSLIVVLSDVSERRALEERLVHEATHDPLTQLPNRALFLERVEHALTRSSRTAERIAIIFLDLDGFKAVNDTQGHGAGDHVLQAASRRLLSATRGCDTVARMGGDEFAVLLEQVDALSGAQAVADRIVCALRLPLEVGTLHGMVVGASLGIAVYSGLEDTTELIRKADVAMYEAKLRNPGRWVVFEPAMQVALIDRVTLQADLRHAVDRCQLELRPRLANTGVYTSYGTLRAASQTEFAVYYQPIIDLKSGEVIGTEALARWTHPERGAIAPDAFIPLAERSGVIAALGRWILNEACRQGAEWNARRPDAPLTMTVNLSGKQLEHPGIAQEVESVLRDTGLPAARLVLEITESVIMLDAEKTLLRLNELKALGVRLAIDDFGTGYSSLSYLQRFPVDIVKIDRTFAAGMRHGAEGIAVIRTILALAEMLSLRTVAEGIEDPEQRDQLLQLGCDAGQGYLYGRPMPCSEIEAMLMTARSPDVSQPA
ncbi:MAG: EAL domain-containing protein [Cytophagaceae bacterium]|nr:EAL domain-containing protein [Gemmatimonadaceae bacterium]